MLRVKKLFALLLIAALSIAAPCGPRETVYAGAKTVQQKDISERPVRAYELTSVKWNGKGAVELNSNRPQFKTSSLKYKKTFVNATGKDRYGRPGVVTAVLGNETVNYGDREDIGHIRPAGWVTVKYPDIVNGMYLYNRCHLIAQSLAAGKYEDVINSDRNLITGTRYMNVDGMEDYEMLILDHLKHGKYHVMYRVQPIYKGKELLCRGVWIQASSMEDKGGSLRFNVYCPNVQPGVTISYRTGKSEKSGNSKDIALALKYGATSVKEAK